MQYLTDWTPLSGSVSTDLTDRPLPVGALFDNTTVQGSWIDVQDMKSNSDIFDRMVNNVSLAMPHSGVFAAAMNPLNRILQPQDLDVSCIFHFIKRVVNHYSGSWRVLPRSFGSLTGSQCIVRCNVSGRACANGRVSVASSYQYNFQRYRVFHRNRYPEQFQLAQCYGGG